MVKKETFSIVLRCHGMFSYNVSPLFEWGKERWYWWWWYHRRKIDYFFVFGTGPVVMLGSRVFYNTTFHPPLKKERHFT
jgi:hypothetical protein